MLNFVSDIIFFSFVRLEVKQWIWWSLPTDAQMIQAQTRIEAVIKRIWSTQLHEFENDAVKSTGELVHAYARIRTNSIRFVQKPTQERKKNTTTHIEW